MNEAATALAKEIISSNMYMTLATSADNAPWASPVYYCVDDGYNFYFISQLESLHTQNLLKNPNVSVAIFDSTAEEGKGSGVQAAAHVEMIEGIESIANALETYSTAFIDLSPEMLNGESGYKIFRIRLETAYVTDVESEVDARVQVTLA